MTEFDCFVKSFYYLLKCMPASKLLHPCPPDALQHAKEKVQLYQSYFEKMKEMNFTQSKRERFTQDNIDAAKQYVDELETRDDSKPYVERDDMFPCILGTLGSAVAFIRVIITLFSVCIWLPCSCHIW